MTLQRRKAVTSNAKPLIGLYAVSGAGKTYSALALALGFVGPGNMGQVVMIETEAGRGEAWANDPELGGYDVITIAGNFAPKVYGAAISEAEKTNARVLIIDSASHEWEGVGGVQAMAADNQAAGRKGVLVWQQPKIEHSREFMLRITQTSIPLVIVCMRARYPMEQITQSHVEHWREQRVNAPGKVGDWIRSQQLEPKQSEDILSEMFVHGWIEHGSHNFHVTKLTLDALGDVFRNGEPISPTTGRRLAAWAANPTTRAASKPTTPVRTTTDEPAASPPATVDQDPECITEQQVRTIETACTGGDIAIDSLKKAVGVKQLAQIKSVDYQRALDWIGKVIEARDARSRTGLV